jgi:RNA polymerase sigma factor (sigma-70 family)
MLGDRAMWLAREVLPHEQALRGWLRHKRIVECDIDDVVQETYAILAGRESIQEIRNAKTYAFQVARSVILMNLRRSRIVSFRQIGDVDLLGAISDVPSPECQVADRDELSRIGQAIAQLPSRVRETFILRRIEDLSQREIAKRLGISENTVEKNIGKAIRILMDLFGRGGNALSRTSNGRNARLVISKADSQIMDWQREDSSDCKLSNRTRLRDLR